MEEISDIQEVISLALFKAKNEIGKQAIVEVFKALDLPFVEFARLVTLALGEEKLVRDRELYLVEQAISAIADES